MSHDEGTSGLKRFARNATDSKLGRLVAGGIVIGTVVYFGATVEKADCDADSRGPRIFGAREDPDSPGNPLLANVPASVVAGKCIRPTPLSVTDSQGRVWYLWKCDCEGQQCCTSLDHAQYVCSTIPECIQAAKELAGTTFDKTTILCALDPAGCTSSNGAEPCRKPVAQIPSERRPPEAEWGLCHDWAPRVREDAP